jgi:hypothetical protein
VKLLEVTAVRLAEAGGALLAHGIDTPAPGQSSPFYGFDVRGWAVGRDRPAESVIVRHPGGELRRTAVGGERPDVAERFPERAWSLTSGYLAPLGALRLPPRFELDVAVRLADGSSAPVAAVEGRRDPLVTAFEPRIRPVCLTALGRTGSTAVAQLVSSHPAVAAYRPFLYEPRVVSYWLDVLTGLAEPVAFRRQITPRGPLSEGWWTGAREPYPGRIGDDDVQGWLGGENIAALASFCQGRIDDFYSRIAERFDRPGAAYFIEKLGPDAGALTRELYPSARELFLVRDFRDVAASIFAYNEKRGFQGFGRDRVASDAEYVSERLSESVASFMHAWRTRSAGAHLVRYEDLVREPRATLAAILDHLELDTPSATLDAMLESLRAHEADVHRTSAAEDSIGRWRTDLQEDVKAACERAFGEALHELGYER